MPELTDKQQEILEYIASCPNCPSYSEIGAKVGMCKQRVAQHVQRLVDIGVLAKGSGYRDLTPRQNV